MLDSTLPELVYHRWEKVLGAGVVKNVEVACRVNGVPAHPEAGVGPGALHWAESFVNEQNIRHIKANNLSLIRVFFIAKNSLFEDFSS